MSKETKELLAFSGLLAILPIAMVSYLGSTSLFAIMYFDWMEPLEAMLTASVITGICNGASFFVLMMAARYIASFVQKFKGDK